MIRVVFVLLMGFAVVSCSSVEFTPNPGADVTTAYQGRVIVLHSLPAAGTYTVLGVVSVTGRTLADKADLVELIVERAGKAGANAVVIQGKGVEVPTNTGSHTKMAGTAILLD